MDKALEGIHILDMSRVQAGPSCAQLLAFLGADVVKLEDVTGGDNTRIEMAHREGVDSVYFTIFNSNKRAITLDLKTERGKELFSGLVEWADIVLENFSKGVMERLGFGYAALKQINPRVIHASIKGFGEYGPYSNYKSYEFSAQAAGGLMAANGHADGPPLATPEGAGDSGTGLHIAIGILAALHQRDRTGEGQHVEVSMQDGIVNLMRIRLMQSLGPGGPNRRRGPSGPSGAPSVFPCHPGGYDDYIMINLRDDLWEVVLAVIGREDLIGDARYATNEARGQRVDEVEALVTGWTSKRTKHEAFHELASMGVWCGPVLSPEEVLDDEQLLAREMIVDVEDPVRGDYQMIGCPIKLEESPAKVVRAPLYSQHTDEVLSSILGVSDGEIVELREQGVIV